MTRIRRNAAIAAATAATTGLLALAVGACVGDSPPAAGTPAVPEAGTNTGPAEGGADTGLPPVGGGMITDDAAVADAGKDAHAPTCAGQVFATPALVVTALVSGALATTMWGLRVVGPNAYFSAVPSGGSEQQLFRATFAPGAGGAAPTLSNASVVAPPSSASVVEWAPTVSTDSALLVFATGFPPPRNLSLSIGSGGAFAAPGPIAALNTAQDETDPWLVGKPVATALYFARDNGASSMEIWRSAVSAGPLFAAPTKIALVCPQLNCGTPVVTPDETTLLYASWATSGFVPNVEESPLAVAAGTGTAGAAIGHPELGSRYPSWVSDDGCEVLLGGGGISTINDMYYARRVAK